jgi:hypothetical protein
MNDAFVASLQRSEGLLSESPFGLSSTVTILLSRIPNVQESVQRTPSETQPAAIRIDIARIKNNNNA